MNAVQDHVTQAAAASLRSIEDAQCRAWRPT